MRSAILVLTLCRCLIAQQAAGVAGTAIDALTRQPLAGVHITMRAVSAQSPSDTAYGAISGHDGRFSIAGMPPALYFLSAQHNGYVYAPGDASVVLKPGVPLTGFTFEMVPRASISGRVVDEYGDPVQHITVDAVPVNSGSPVGQSFSMSGRTDERGHFRMTGAPGRFYIVADMTPTMSPAITEINTDGLGPPVYGTTYYPASDSKDRASAVEVAAGHDLNGIDIRLVRKRSLTISGVVTERQDRSTSATTPPATPAMVLLFARGENGYFHAVREFVVNSEGKFTISGLTSGFYRLLGQHESAGAFLQSRCVDVPLDSTNESGVSLALAQGEVLSGTLEIQGDNATSTEKSAVQLEKYSETGACYSGDPKRGEVDRDGAFRIEQVFPEKFRIRVLPMPENGYVKSVKLDAVETQDDALDLSRGVREARIKVVVSRNGGQVEGSILGEDGEPLQTPFAFVVLAATAKEIDGEHLKPVEAGAKFKFNGLRPGKYRLMAIDPRQYNDDLEGVRAMFPKAPEIEIREGDRITRDAKVIKGDNPGAKP